MQTLKRIALVAAAALLAATIVPLRPVAADSLYDELGQKAGITKVLVDMVGFIADDGRINHFFAHADIPHLEGELVDQVCYVSGGPCTYTGKSMQDAHKGMDIKEADFNALVEDLQKAMYKNDVPLPVQNHLIAALAPLFDSVTYK
jgi:hemoglobin